MVMLLLCGPHFEVQDSDIKGMENPDDIVAPLCFCLYVCLSFSHIHTYLLVFLRKQCCPVLSGEAMAGEGIKELLLPC